jgi:RimJ/RimL family protein N-acetyltransferase
MSAPAIATFETERLQMRPLAMSDVDAALVYQSDAEVVKYIPWPQRDHEQVVAAFEKQLPLSAMSSEGDYFLSAITLKSSGELIGQLNAMYRSEVDQHAEIGYVLNPAYSHQGYATEAVSGLITQLFNTGKFHRITTHIDDRNLKSIALVERLGLRQESHKISAEFFKGEWTSIVEHAILKREWEERAK